MKIKQGGPPPSAILATGLPAIPIFATDEDNFQIHGKRSGRLRGYVEHQPRKTRGPRHQKPRKKK